jgi:general secretion pathway protein C
LETLLKRHFWIVNLLGLGVVAWLVAATISAFGGVLLARAAGQTEGKQTIAAKAGETRLQKRLKDGRVNEVAGAEMAGRSPFVIEEPMEELPPEPEPEPELKSDAPPEPTYQPTSLPIKLLGTMVVSPETWSSATLELDRQNQKIVTQGTDVLGGQAVIYAIRRNYVVLKEGDKLTIAPLFQGEGGSSVSQSTPPPAPEPRPEPPKPSRSMVEQPGIEGVRKISETAFQLDRNHVNDKLKDLAALGQQARVVPNYRGGKYDGVRMVGMSEESLFKGMGFQNGDILMAVNGDRIDSPNKALALYEALKNKARLTVLLEREGIAKTLRYTVR